MYRNEKTVYSRTIGELLHEVCAELMECQDMLVDILGKRERLSGSEKDEKTALIYDFAEEQIRLRIERYHTLGDSLDVLVSIYEEIDELSADEDEDEENYCSCDSIKPYLHVHSEENLCDFDDYDSEEYFDFPSEEHLSKIQKKKKKDKAKNKKKKKM